MSVKAGAISDTPAGGLIRRVRLPNDRRTPAAARALVRSVLEEAELDALLNEALLLTTELSTNAVVHANTELDIEVTADHSGLTVTVTDFAPGPVEQLAVGPKNESVDIGEVAERGRGLLLVDHFASRWGTVHEGTGKGVWFRLERRPAEATTPATPSSQALALPAGHVADTGTPGVGILASLLQLGPERQTEDSLTEFATELLARLARLTGAAGGVVRLDRGDGGGRQLLARFGRAPRDNAATIRVPLRVHRPYAGELELDASPTGYAQPLAALVAERFSLHLENDRLRRADLRRQTWLTFLAEASELLAGCLDQEKTIALAAQLVVPRLGAWFAALLPDDDGELKLAYVWHADESLVDELTRLLNEIPASQVVPGDGARPWSLASAARARPPEPAFGVTAGLASDPAWRFPLAVRDRSLGVIMIGRPREGALAKEAVGLAEDLTRRVALALDNARLYAEQRQATSALQRSLLPPELPDIPGMELAAGYEAAGAGNEVGGDFYDVFEATPGRWRFAIGDVCGKGPEAAAVTGLTRHALRILAREGHDVPTVLERLNALIVDEGTRARFITLIHGELIPAPGPGEAAAIYLVCAGHPPPLVLRSGGVVETAAHPQPLLGVLDRVTFGQSTLRMFPGDVLLCVTDGVTERRSAGRLLDDDDGLRNLLGECSELSAGSVVARIQRAVREFGSDPPADDLAVLVFRGL